MNFMYLGALGNENTYLTATSYNLKASGDPTNAASSASCERYSIRKKDTYSQRPLTIRATHVLVFTGLGDSHLHLVSATP